jgi:hypothetical protein
MPRYRSHHMLTREIGTGHRYLTPVAALAAFHPRKEQVEAFRPVLQVEFLQHFARRQAHRHAVAMATDVNADTNFRGGGHDRSLRKSKPAEKNHPPVSSTGRATSED